MHLVVNKESLVKAIVSKIVGLAFEVYDSENLKQEMRTHQSVGSSSSTENVQPDERPEIKASRLKTEHQSISVKPTFMQVFAYSYCYIGLLTGPYFKFRTYLDWLDMKHGNRINSIGFILKRGRTLPLIITSFLLISQFITFQV
jgi:lysophospholipid acyltransferase 7